MLFKIFDDLFADNLALKASKSALYRFIVVYCNISHFLSHLLSAKDGRPARTPVAQKDKQLFNPVSPKKATATERFIWAAAPKASALYKQKEHARLNGQPTFPCY